MSRITESARGEDCQIRLPNICNGNPETTVLAHYRLHSGIGIKPNDMQGAYACQACHDEVDRRTRIIQDTVAVRLAHAEGVFRTQEKLRDKGLIR